jgi:hypothetical protein
MRKIAAALAASIVPMLLLLAAPASAQEATQQAAAGSSIPQGVTRAAPIQGFFQGPWEGTWELQLNIAEQSGFFSGVVTFLTHYAPGTGVWVDKPVPTKDGAHPFNIRVGSNITFGRGGESKIWNLHWCADEPAKLCASGYGNKMATNVGLRLTRVGTAQ